MAELTMKLQIEGLEKFARSLAESREVEASTATQLRGAQAEVEEFRQALAAAMDHIFGEQQLTGSELDDLQEMACRQLRGVRK